MAIPELEPRKPAFGRYLTDDELALVLARARKLRLEAGQPLLRLGQPGDRLYYLERGELAISLPLGGETVSLGTRHAGTWVGEITWLEPGPVTASAVATRDSQLLVLARVDLLALGREHPGLAARLVRAVSEDLARRVRHAGVVLESPGPAAQEPGAVGRLLRLLGAGAG
jgi:SulP family sulfate permease